MNDPSPQTEEHYNQEPAQQENTQELIQSYRTKALKKRSLFLFPLSYLGFVIALGAIFGIVYTISTIVSSGGDTGSSIESDFTSMTYILLYLDAIGFIVAFILFKSVRTFTLEKMSLKPLKNVMTYVWIFLGIGLILGAQILVFEVLQLETPNNQDQLFGITADNFTLVKYIFLFVIVALITPIKEELLFRGFLLRFFQAKYAKAWLGIFISSTVFGILHPGYPLVGAVMGLVFGGLYLKTNSIVVPIVTHIIWNTYVSLVGLSVLM